MAQDWGGHTPEPHSQGRKVQALSELSRTPRSSRSLKGPDRHGDALLGVGTRARQAGWGPRARASAGGPFAAVSQATALQTGKETRPRLQRARPPPERAPTRLGT